MGKRNKKPLRRVSASFVSIQLWCMNRTFDQNVHQSSVSKIEMHVSIHLIPLLISPLRIAMLAQCNPLIY